MKLDRRAFTRGMVGVAIGSQFGSPLLGEGMRAHAGALEAIRELAAAEIEFNRLPGLTLGLCTADGHRTVMNLGFANVDSRLPITPEILFQIGSISKVMIALVIHQLASEGRIGLTDQISARLPQVPLPANSRIEVQHLLDHVAGLPDDPPVFVPGGLWTAYAPGQHWHYSNTGYEILGKLIEQLVGKPLAKILKERIFSPLGMTRSRGAITDNDRALFAQGYEAADRTAAYLPGVALAPAPWVDVTAGAGCVASTADDMLSFLRGLASAIRGKGGLGLTPPQARLLTTHAVPSDLPTMSYGNGLMHVSETDRSYLHHTGGMLSFSSSFHVDALNGNAAFASSTLSAFAEYRPRLLTRFAVDALTSVSLGRPLPPLPALGIGLPNASAYVGHYNGRAGSFEIRGGSPLTIVAAGRSAPLVPVAQDIFRTMHPSFRQYSMLFERLGGRIALASFGSDSFLRDASGGVVPVSDPKLARLAGRFVNDNPWYGPLAIVERGGKLWIGTEIPMTAIGDNLWRIGKERWSPERASFADFLGAQPQSFIFSGVKFARHDV